MQCYYSSNVKEIYALVATIFIVIAYWPYIRDVKQGKTWPHPYTWFISGFVTFIVFALQLSDGAGWGVLPTFVGAAAGLTVFGLGLANKRPKITKSDTFFLALAVMATVLWLVAKQPIASIILLTTIDIFAFIPTVRKSWQHPEQETVSTYFTNATRFAFSVAATRQYTIITVLYPAISMFCDASTGIYLLARRKRLQ